jgi:adenine-specific DNA-methyltransferase
LPPSLLSDILEQIFESSTIPWQETMQAPSSRFPVTVEPGPAGQVSGLGEDLHCLLDYVETLRIEATQQLDPDRRVTFGQFFTPVPTARLMAGMFRPRRGTVRLLDPGAGVGSLTAAYVAEMCDSPIRPGRLHVTAYEVDPVLTPYLAQSLAACQSACERAGIAFTSTICNEDFIEAAASVARGDFFSPEAEPYQCAIVNPPYHKIHSSSRTRQLLSSIGVETSNLYTGFLSVIVRLLNEQGELVAITPRSFCNGPYFRRFREDLLARVSFDRFHIFESREHVFRDDEVLQENIVFHAVSGNDGSGEVHITAGLTAEDGIETSRTVPFAELVRPEDPNRFIHLVADEWGSQIATRMARLSTTLAALGLNVSTGRVVDFRAQPFLRMGPSDGTVPLIYPSHLRQGVVTWPGTEGKRPNALIVTPESRDLLVPAETYVLVRRFSAKEEKRRVVAGIFDHRRLAVPLVGFENHLNYYHRNGGGLDEDLAKGLALYLNSTLVDAYFRQFNGHTQVNATDLRSLPYPTLEQLQSLGGRLCDKLPEQGETDRIIDEELFPMTENSGSPNPVRAKNRIDEALKVLRELGMPRGQQNERSALTLLSLLDLKPETPWSEAAAPLRGITPMMEFFAQHYGKPYAPNTRETVRRETVHQFLEAGLILINPDEPKRPVNSPRAAYQIEPEALALLRTYSSEGWGARLQAYLARVGTLKQRYARERDMERIAVTVSGGGDIQLSPGGQNVLIGKIVHEFCPRFTPGGVLLYVGDAKKKWAHFDVSAFTSLGISVGEHGKMPDVVVHHAAKEWLVLVEAVTSHGPVNPKRRAELETLFRGASAGLVFVTAFLTRKDMVRYLRDISWETEVWLAESPSHLIHFNGERFLGPP